MNPFVLHNIIPKVSNEDLLPYTGPELFRWWDPGDSLNVTKSGGRFDQVNDKSGNSGHLTSSGTFRPFDSRLINGFEFLDFRSSQYMINDWTIISQPLTYIYVIKADNITTTFMCHYDGYDSSGRLVSFNTYITPNYYFYAGNDYGGAGSPSLDLELITVNWNGSSTKAYRNGVLILNGNVGNNGSKGITLGSRYTRATQFDDSAIGEFFIYTSMSLDNINQTGQYLANKYAISYTDIT